MLAAAGSDERESGAMTRRASPIAGGSRWCAGAMVALSLAAIPGCRSGETPSAADAGPARQLLRYTVRGEVARLPDPTRAGGEIYVRHEAIDDFVDRSGQEVGMASMIMPFRVEPPLHVRGLAVGDKVELRFAVDWSRPAFWLEGIEKLPAATPLRFGPPRPAGGTARPSP